MNVLLLVLTIVFLLGMFFLTAVNSAFRRIYRTDFNKKLLSVGKAFFYRNFHLFFFPKHEYEGLFFATICAQNIARIVSTGSFLLFLLSELLFFSSSIITLPFAAAEGTWLWFFIGMIGYLIVSFLIGDCLPRIFGTRFPDTALRVCTPVASLFLFLAFPFTYFFLKISQSVSRSFYFDLSYEPMDEAQREIIEMIQKADLGDTAFDKHDKKLIESVMRFKERIAREVMVPRVNVFSLAAETTIKQAAHLLANEGYSRTPIYQGTVDNIVGVLMYKDILNKYREYELQRNNPAILEAPIQSIQKSVLHIPETKKLSALLQEFRKKQVHLAIVVDEYGGTEGIVTIEDILEEIVGEIADEYDQEAELYYAQPDGTWVVDARMNILDAEGELGIKIPEEGDYDTIGGYIFHTAGSIPSKGFIIHHDAFDMEVLLSNDRCVEKVRIKPIISNANDKTQNEKKPS